MNPEERVLSPKHSLTQKEMKYCKIYASNGHKRPGDAYRQSFMERNLEGDYIEPPRDDMTRDEKLDLRPHTASQINKKANNLLKQDKIRDYIDWLASRPGDIAKNAMVEQALFGEQNTQMRAAETLLDLEDKMGLKDGYEKWAEIMCLVGTEVVVPLPGSHGRDEGGPREVAFPLSEMFPKYKGKLPDKDTLTKTVKSLNDYIEKYHP